MYILVACFFLTKRNLFLEVPVRVTIFKYMSEEIFNVYGNGKQFQYLRNNLAKQHVAMQMLSVPRQKSQKKGNDLLQISYGIPRYLQISFGIFRYLLVAF